MSLPQALVARDSLGAKARLRGGRSLPVTTRVVWRRCEALGTTLQGDGKASDDDVAEAGGGGLTTPSSRNDAFKTAVGHAFDVEGHRVRTAHFLQSCISEYLGIYLVAMLA